MFISFGSRLRHHVTRTDQSGSALKIAQLKLKIDFKNLSLEETHVWGNASLRSSTLACHKQQKELISIKLKMGPWLTISDHMVSYRKVHLYIWKITQLCARQWLNLLTRLYGVFSQIKRKGMVKESHIFKYSQSSCKRIPSGNRKCPQLELAAHGNV